MKEAVVQKEVVVEDGMEVVVEDIGEVVVEVRVILVM